MLWAQDISQSVANCGGANKRLRLGALFMVCTVLGLSGCVSSGPMTVTEVSYLAVPSGDNTNFYRISVLAETYLGVSHYDSGWFPADTVDRLYGSTAKSGAGRARKTEQDIRAYIDDAIKNTTQGYLLAAQDPDTSEVDILKWLTAQRRVRAMAGDGIPLPQGAIEVEYDPAKNLALRHAGQKRVFVLASNPDDVIKAIKGFAQSEETSATVLRLAEVIKQRNINDIEKALAEMVVQQKINDVIVSQINGALDVTKDKVDRDTLLTEIETLLMLIESAR